MREVGICGYGKTLGNPNDMVEGLQVPRRSDRQRVRERRMRKWVERSVWTEVLAKELGLIVTPSLTFTENFAKESKKNSKQTISKQSSSRGVERRPRFYRPRKVNSSSTLKRPMGIIETKEIGKHHVFNDHLYTRPAPSDSHDKPRQSNKHSSGKKYSSTTKTIVYNPFNVFSKALKDFSARQNESRTEPARKDSTKNSAKTLVSGRENSSIKSEGKTQPKAGTRNRNLGRTNEIRRKNEVRKKFNRKAKDDTKRATLVSTSRKNEGIVFESSDDADSTEDDETWAIRKKQWNTRITKRNNRKIEKKDLKIHFQESDIDESLLVDPSTDLPESLLETIDDKIVLNNAEFDPSRDLNFETDERLTSTFDSFERDFLSNCEATNVGLSPKIKSIPKIDMESRKEKNSPTKREENTEKKRRRSADDDVINKMSFGREEARDRMEKIVPERRRRPASDVAALTEKQGNRVDDKTAPEKRRASADASMTNRATSVSTRKSSDKENSYRETFERVTRSSMKNFAVREITDTRSIGTIVWGNCMGWWPGFIVDAEDVGMLSIPEKSWVCWIGEYKISHLRDKTQIQSFSFCFRERMIDTLKAKNTKDQSYRACMETIELINDNILRMGPLTRPHHVWVEKNLASLKNLDRLIIHPYPLDVKPRLDQLRKTNGKATEKYLSELKTNGEKSSSSPKSSTINKTAGGKNAFVPVPGHLPLMKQKPGVIAWAKIMGQVWWPAVIIDYRDWGMKEPSFGCQWIVWYGDNTMSQVNHRFFLSFENGMALMKEYTRNCRRECYRRGVIDAAKDYCSRYGYKTEDWRIDDIFGWFESNEDEASSSPEKNVLPGIPGNPEISQRYPPRIVQVLRKHRGNCTVAAAREHTIQESEAMTLVSSCKMKIERLCLMCLRECEEETAHIEHPFFLGKLCDECSEKYKPTIFAYGEDGKCFFCTICAGSDTVVMCDEEDCPRVYCTACIKYLVAPRFYDDILLKDPWPCFICDPSEDFVRDGLLKPRRDWKDRVSGLFRSSRDSIPSRLEHYKNDGKRKIRVLSLFDGISAGLVVLKKLGIQIEVYYASEIDPDAEMVSSAHHGREIVKRLGDVRTVTEDKLRDIVPIDLLIGGSPCNDLSLVNPLRLGLHDPNGTGILVFEYCRVKNFLEKHNGRHFFWMFENVASMPSKYRLEINKHLGREPELIDSANYSPQHRPRLYWSNLPIVSFPLSTQDLQDVLTPNCNRHALVKKIRTVTTRVNSLKQGRDALKPILMNETNDTLWITELEEIFGFPKHYTDVKNLCATKRQKLIAMSWSVQTIMEIMRPLCNFFHTRNDDSP